MNYLFQLFFSFNKMVFLRCELKNISNFSLHDSDISFENVNELDQKKIEQIIEIGYPARISENEIIDRLKRGDLLYVAREQEGLIAYQWIALNKYYIPYLDGEITLDSDEFYGYGSSVLEKYRGQGLYNHLRKYTYQNLYSRGYRTGITSYMSWNKSIERANKKFGYQELGEIIYGYIFLFRYFVNKMPKGKVRHLDNFWGKWKKLANR